MYNILIVDDEKIERNGIKFLLKQFGMQLNVFEATNGAKALEFLETQQVDILLTDVKMPFMDGIELCTEIRKRGWNMKILIFSGYSEFEYARMAVKLGVTEYILKPVDPNEFEHIMNGVIQELDEVQKENSRLETSKQFMKEHILYLLVNGTPLSEIEHNFAGLIELEFLQGYKKMMLIETSNDFFGKTGMSFADALTQKVSAKFQYLNLNLQQSLMLFTEEELPFAKIAEEVHEFMLKEYQVTGYVAIGSDIQQADELCTKLEELERLMENKFYVSNTYIFGSGEKDESVIQISTEEDSLMKQMRQDIKMKDISSLEDHIEQLYEKYQYNKLFSQIYVKFIFSNLLKDIYDNIPNHTEVQLNKDVEELYQANEFSTVKEIIARSVDRLKAVFKQNPQMYHREIEFIKQYIYDNYDKELGVEQLADKVSLAPSYLSHIFKKETGQNLSKFIKAYRMEMAKKMLEETHDKIVSISYAVGYVNVSYFCQSFREYFGVSPQKYRTQGE